MAQFNVTVKGVEYEVDAPDENTAWAWANQTHEQEQTAIKEDVAKMREGGAIERVLRGAGRSLQNEYYGLKGLVTDLSPEERKQVAVNKQFLGEDTAGAVGGFGADVASFLLPGGVAGKAVTKGLTMLPKAARAYQGLGAGTRLATQMAGQGALDAALSAAYAPENRGEAATMGGLGSVGGQAAGRFLGRTLSGLVKPSEAAERLMARGIQPTIGQAADQGSMVGRTLRRTEEGAQSIPWIGDIIGSSRNRANKEAMRSAASFSDEALDAYRGVPGVRDLPKNVYGNELLKIVNENASSLYDDALERVGFLQLGGKGKLPKLGGVDIRTFAKREAAAKGIQSNSIVDFIENTIGEKIGSGKIDGRSWKLVDEELGKNAAAFSSSENATDRQLGAVYREVQKFWREWLEDNAPKEISEQLGAANKAWANLLPLEKAASSAAARKSGGVFTGGGLQTAVAGLDKSRFDRASRYNPRPIESFANDASDVLGNTLADSGTANRLMIGGGIGLGVMPFGGLPGYLAATAGTAGAYSKGGQKLLLGNTAKQKAIRDFLRRNNLDPYTGGVGAALTND
jgi:hypothetical protein